MFVRKKFNDPLELFSGTNFGQLQQTPQSAPGKMCVDSDNENGKLTVTVQSSAILW